MRMVLGYILAVVVVLIIGAGAHAVFNQGDLAALGGDFTFGQRVEWIIHDIIGMAPLYGAIMGAALLVAFLAAGFVSRFAAGLRTIVFVVAGGVAVAVALIAMAQVFEIMPIASAREMDGFIGQAIAGALAGLTYVLIKRPA